MGWPFALLMSYLYELRLYGGGVDTLAVEEAFDFLCYNHVVPEILATDMCRCNDAIAS